jgi:FKBP-type peptidyl-prolyl cis-trans isomerase
MATAPRNFLYLALLGVVLLTIAIVVRSGMLARKDNPRDRPINSAMREAMEESGRPQLSTQDAMLVAQKYSTARGTDSGLLYVEKQRGTGLPPTRGATVTAHYDGRLLDGTPFDSSYNRGLPIDFKVGVGQVIKGWDEAFLTMKKGEKRTLIIPYWLGYGVSGKPPTIPPRATLVFEVELVDFR